MPYPYHTTTHGRQFARGVHLELGGQQGEHLQDSAELVGIEGLGSAFSGELLTENNTQKKQRTKNTNENWFGTSSR